MPALPPYIPAAQADFNNWANNFATVVNGSPATFGLTAGDGASIAAAVANWNATFAAVIAPGQKTKTTVQAKNTARVATTATLRLYSQAIANNPGVATEDKLNAGVNPRTSKPTPITPPDTYPVLSIQAGANKQLYVRFRDSSTSTTSKAKPYGVQSCQLFYTVSDTPVTDPTLLTTQVTLTKSPSKVSFAPSAAGKQAYLAAYWLLANGKQSDWGPIVSFTVPLGS
jgi:hypothetical protein